MIDRLKSRFGEAGLTYSFKGLTEETCGFLPEPACLSEGKLSLLDGVDPDTQFQAAVGAVALDVFRKMDEKQRQRWELALFQVNPASFRLIQEALKSSSGFKEAVESLESPVTRLVAIHLFNALIKGGVSYTTAQSADLSQWGSTAELVSGKRLCSLLPLLGAYAPARLYGYFPDAVTSLVVDGLKPITYSEVRSTFADVVKVCFNG